MGEVDAFTSFCNVSISSCQPFIVARYNKLCVLCIAYSARIGGLGLL